MKKPAQTKINLFLAENLNTATNNSEHGQVFTPFSICEQLLEQAKSALLQTTNEDKTMCDPCCGNGQIIVYTMAKRIEAGQNPLMVLKNTYGIELLPLNTESCRQRITYLMMQALNQMTDEEIAWATAKYVVNPHWKVLTPCMMAGDWDHNDPASYFENFTTDKIDSFKYDRGSMAVILTSKKGTLVVSLSDLIRELTETNIVCSDFFKWDCEHWCKKAEKSNKNATNITPKKKKRTNKKHGNRK